MDVLSYISKLFSSDEPTPEPDAPASAPLALKSAPGIPRTHNEVSWMLDDNPWQALKKVLGPTSEEIAAMPEFARPPEPESEFAFLRGAQAASEPIPAGGSGATPDLKLKTDTRNPFEGTPQLKVDTHNPFEGLSGAVAEVNRRGRARIGATSKMKLNRYDTIPTIGVRG